MEDGGGWEHSRGDNPTGHMAHCQHQYPCGPQSLMAPTYAMRGLSDISSTSEPYDNLRIKSLALPPHCYKPGGDDFKY